jgi:hypothetical protein
MKNSEGFKNVSIYTFIMKATIREIQNYVRKKYGFAIKSCWIADAKEKCGLEVIVAYNRIDPNKRKYPCPDDKLPAIKDAFKHFKMI